ncbi:hypothetical protein MMA231_04028 (plasmid) [Asticcacaulis sp. MM231]|uniref:hypothetical protein n=1 Tax=Asticcacaulis sp. MM231 TaxID=3157666 RepID=UPI0032D5830E
MSIEKTRIVLSVGAVTGGALLLLLGFIDPTQSDSRKLDALAKDANAAPKLSTLAKKTAHSGSADSLVEHPIFVMTTGTGAYAEKTFQLFGVSISASRKAALVGIDGASPAWLRAGELSGDVQLIDVQAGSARFDTPLGERTVNMSDTPAAAAPTSSVGG